MPRTPVAALAAAVLAAGCGWTGEDPDLAEHEVRLNEMHHETVRLLQELGDAEARIILDCLEDQGLTVHDEQEVRIDFGLLDSTFIDRAPHEHFLPSEEEASFRGYWQWTRLDGAEAAADPELWAAYEADTADRLPSFDVDERSNEEFRALPPEDQYAWYESYAGESWAAYRHGDLVGIEPERDSDDVVIYDFPAPGGCQRTMIDAVYGGVEGTENEETGRTDWSWRPEPPNGDGSQIDARYFAGVEDAEPDFLDCLHDKGRGGWELRQGHLAVNDYLADAGEGDGAHWAYEGSTGSWPEPPEDVPDGDDFEGWLAFERGFALDVVACGEESGYREAADEAWKQAQLGYYLDIEDDTYAWQEEMRGYLERAQEVIAG